ncbi:MAG: radical SAM protein [Candidatus Omnitrophica bacterium]|nr:radical SAM protein [Candidatus Omnitrophota bacterium]
MNFLYTKTKIFHFADKLNSLAKKNKKILPPIHIRVKPTNVCNHSCSYCSYRKDNLQLGKDMISRDFIPKDKMLEILEDLNTIGVKAITFSGGGEPFCYPYLEDAVKFLINTNIKFAAITNGSKLEGNLAKLFSRYASWIRISIDGWDDESYSFYRKVKKGEFSRILQNIENFKRLKGSCYLGMSIIVDRYNAAHIYQMIKKFKELCVDSVKVSPCIVSDSGRRNNEYHKPIFNLVKKQIKKAFRDFVDKNFEIFDAYHELDEKFYKTYSWCPYLQILCVIGADCNVYSCQDKAYNLKEGLLGSIKNRRFKDFWFSGKAKFFKINPSIHCNHHCVANLKNILILEYLGVKEKHLYFV